MEIFKPDYKLAETCVKCKKPMAPLIYADGRCCDTYRLKFGKTNYKCPGCGGVTEVEHRHKQG